MDANDWRTIATYFDELKCSTHSLAIKGLVLRFEEHNRRVFGHHRYYRRLDDPKGRRWVSEALAARAKV